MSGNLPRAVFSFGTAVANPEEKVRRVKMNITSILLGPKYEGHQEMMTSLAQEGYSPKAILSVCDAELLAAVSPQVLSHLDRKVKDGENLTFEEAFSGMLLVVVATNNLIRTALFPEMSFAEAVAKGVGFLQLMAVKESLRGLAPSEIAGMVAGGSLDIVFRPAIPEVTETCGMGGDRGWGTREVKTISASTLSALVLASLGIPTFKHGSYGNTARVGSTDVPINFGAVIYQRTAAEILRLFSETDFWFSDAHTVKTIHYLSHLLMVETVNHIVGPMTIPVSRETKIFKVIGVNHHVNPTTVAEAYALLHQRGFINLGGVAVVCGLDALPSEGESRDPEWVTAHTFLDEVSPIATLVSLARGGEFLGNSILEDGVFGAPPLPEGALKVRNTITHLMAANEKALRGVDGNLSQYLARNAALGLLVANGLEPRAPFAKLASHYQRCSEAIASGRVLQTLRDYVGVSGGAFQSWL